MSAIAKTLLASIWELIRVIIHHRLIAPKSFLIPPTSRNFLTVLGFSLVHIVGSSLAPTNLLATRVGPCSKPRGLPIKVSEMSILTRIYDSSVTGGFNITQPVQNGWHVKATMLKCQDIRNLDTCDYFRTYQVVRKGCSGNSSAEDQDLYNMFFHHTTPRLSCPIKTGSYKIAAYPFFTEDNYRTVSEAKISTSIFGYTYKLEGYDGDRLMFCVEAYLQLIYVREHNWMNDPGAAPDADAGSDASEDADDEMPDMDV